MTRGAGGSCCLDVRGHLFLRFVCPNAANAQLFHCKQVQLLDVQGYLRTIRERRTNQQPQHTRMMPLVSDSGAFCALLRAKNVGHGPNT